MTLPKAIIVKVGRKKYKTFLDEHGVQRFQQNSVLRFLVDEQIIDLTKLFVAFVENQFSKKDYAEFMMMLGYSVSGFSTLTPFEKMKIDNPNWEDV